MNGPSVKLRGFAPGSNSFRAPLHHGDQTKYGAPILMFGKGRRRRMKGTGSKSPYTKRKVSKLRGRGVKSLQKKIEKQALKQQLAVARGDTQAVTILPESKAQSQSLKVKCLSVKRLLYFGLLSRRWLSVAMTLSVLQVPG